MEFDWCAEGAVTRPGLLSSCALVQISSSRVFCDTVVVHVVILGRVPSCGRRVVVVHRQILGFTGFPLSFIVISREELPAIFVYTLVGVSEAGAYGFITLNIFPLGFSFSPRSVV